MNFFNFFYVIQNTAFVKKKKNDATTVQLFRKILVCDMESWYNNISKIRNITFIFQNFQKRKKIEKI